MKKIFCLLVFCAAILCSCEKNTNQPTGQIVDPRNAYAGTYRFTAKKEIKLYDTSNGKYLTSYYIEYDEVTFMFEKTNDNLLMCSLPPEYDSPLDAFVVDGKLYFKDGYNTFVTQNFFYEFTSTHSSATMTDRKLTWKTNLEIKVTGQGAMKGNEAHGEATIDNTAIYMN